MKTIDDNTKIMPIEMATFFGLATICSQKIYFKHIKKSLIKCSQKFNDSKSSKRKSSKRFRANSEIIGKFRKLETFYGHFVKRQK